MRISLLFCIILWVAIPLRAQTLTDGLMMSQGYLCTGFMLGSDQWTNYWEGALKRDNGNIGTITTQSLTWMGNYGISNRLNVIGMLPYVKTKASMGTLQRMEGLQDMSLGLKYNVFQKTSQTGVFNTFAVLNYAMPVTNYTPDFLPLSIGMGSRNLSGRLTANYTLAQGWYANISGAYTWRSNVSLDRSSYYTDGQLYYGHDVEMPAVIDYVTSLGYRQGNLQTEVHYVQQNTLGGSDIRRQDMPFVSNRMNFSKVGALVMYYLPMYRNLAIRANASFTVNGRNVGQSTTVMAGAMYTFNFTRKNIQAID